MGQVATKQIATIVSSADKTIYVDKGGSDTLGDGSILRPYATITKAMAAVPAFAVGVIWSILVNPGIYNENVSLKPNVVVRGASIENTAIVAPVSIGLDATWAGNPSAFGGFDSIGLSAANNIGFIFGATSTSETLVLNNVRMNSALLNMTCTDSATGFTLIDIIINAPTINITAGAHGWYNVDVITPNAAINIADVASVNTTWTAIGGGTVGTVSAIRSSVPAITFSLTLLGFIAQGGATVQGGIAVTASAESIPGSGGFVLGIGVSGAPTVAYVNYAPALGYSPGTPANWLAFVATLPVNVQIALDDLAAAVSVLSTGISWKNPVQTISTQAIASPPSNATTPLGTAISNYKTAAGTRVALNAQPNPVENGVWVVPAGAAAPWTRATDVPAGSSGLGVAFFVEGVDASNNSSFFVNNSYVQNLQGPGAPPHPVVGTDPLGFVQFGATPVPAILVNTDKNLVPATVNGPPTVPGQTATTTLAISQTSKGYVIVLLNGVAQRVFNGPALATAANLDCFWSTDGVNALANTNVPAGAQLYWSAAGTPGGSGTAPFGVGANDRFDFEYQV